MLSRTIAGIAAAVLLVIPVAEAAAQDVTVTAPRTRVIGRSSTTGAPIELVTTSTIVKLGDLNLRTEPGRTEANKRIEKAANGLCEWLDSIYPNTVQGGPPCVSDAVKRAMADLDASVKAMP